MILSFRSSRRLQLLIAAIHLVAAISFLHLDGSWWLQLLVSGALGLSCLHTVRRNDVARVARIRLEDDGSMALERTGAATVVVRALPSTTDFGWAVWLHWQALAEERGRSRAAKGAEMLLPDQCSADEWRRLRVWLRHRSAAAFRDERGAA